MKDSPKGLRIFLTIINIVIIFFCTACTLLMLFSVLFQHYAKQDKLIFGHHLYINTNNNLKPVMNENDIIIVKPTSITAIKLGDFLCYYPASSDEQEVQFGKIEEINTNEISLSDKAGHNTVLSISDIVVVGKATTKISQLGKAVLFFQSASNRISFYLSVGAITLLLLAITFLLHIKIKSRQEQLEIERQAMQSDSKTFSYTLDDLLEVEDAISFEKAPKPRTEEDVLFKR
ncbi:MAG: hypothetical protein PUB00_08065 [Clostridiales bacterium]|nr:hypothetical protein [Clostridiales bacterium]